MSEEKRSEDELEDKDPAADEAPAGGAETEGGDAPASEPPAARAEADEGDDAASPEAIARRVAALGDDDAADRMAREEERKLAERRAGAKKGKKKSGLEAAASKKLSKIGARAEPKRAVAVAADADPLIERTAKISEWAKKNQKLVQVFGAALCVVLLGVAGYLWYDHKRETEASQILAKAVEAQRAQIGEPSKDDDEEDDATYYKTFAERRAAALTQYRDVMARFPGTGAAILARLAEGSLLLDDREHAAALAAFKDVDRSPLAAADPEVKGRALEGMGFAHELAAAATPAEKDKHLDEALAAFKELESAAPVKGFKELATYHQARVLMSKGDKDKAKELLLSLKERFDATEESVAPGLPPPPSFPYLREMAMDRLREIDPTAVPKQGGGLSPAQIRKLMEEAQKKGGGH